MRKNSCMISSLPGSARLIGRRRSPGSIPLYARAAAPSIGRFGGSPTLRRGFFCRLLYGSLAGTAFLTIPDFLEIRLELLALRFGERLGGPRRGHFVNRLELGLDRRALRHVLRQPERRRQVVAQGGAGAKRGREREGRHGPGTAGGRSTAALRVPRHACGIAGFHAPPGGSGMDSRGVSRYCGDLLDSQGFIQRGYSANRRILAHNVAPVARSPVGF